jgi:deoxyribose-phosphate aldolase
MQIEYSYYDVASNDAEIKDTLSRVSKYPIQSISVLPPYVKLAKSIVGGSPILISTPVDYPMGILDSQNRLDSIEHCIKNGAKIIDLVCPVYLLTNRKYDKFREDIKNSKALCEQHKVELRYILEYRLYSYDLLYKIAQILVSYDIKIAYPSTGFLLDNLSDNILACALINKKVNTLNIICNGNLWNDSQAALVEKANLYGLRVNSINGLELIYQKVSKSIN